MSAINTRFILFFLITITSYHTANLGMQAGPSKEEKDKLSPSEIMATLQRLLTQRNLVDTSRSDTMIDQLRENRLDEERLPRNPLRIHQNLPRLHRWLSFLLLQEELMQHVRANYQAQNMYLTLSQQASEQYGDVYTYTIDPIAGVKTRVNMPHDTPELIAATIFLARAYQEHMSPETIITVLNEKYTQSTDRRIKVALLFKIMESHNAIRDQALARAVTIAWKLLTISPLRMLQPLGGYCYPAARWYTLCTEYCKSLMREQSDESFSEAAWTRNDQINHEQRRHLIDWYDSHASEFSELKKALIDQLTIEMRHIGSVNSSFSFNYFDKSIQLPLHYEIVHERSPIDYKLLQEIEPTYQKTLKKKTKKKRAASRAHEKASSSLEQKPEEDADESSSAAKALDDRSEQHSEEESPDESAPAPVSPSRIQQTSSYLYLPRVLDWHDDPARALARPEYTFRPLSPRTREEIINKHRIPFIIEERYKKHAIKSRRANARCPNGYAVVLNFPGAISYTTHNTASGEGEQRYMHGYFAIDINQSTREIYHRCFHEETATDLEQAICSQRLQAEFPPLESLPATTEHTAMCAANQTPYTIVDDGLRIHITDPYGVTYILFKKPTTTRR